MVRSLFIRSTDSWKRIARYLLLSLVIGVIVFLIVYSKLFGPVNNNIGTTQFLVQPESSVPTLTRELHQEGLIRNQWAVRIALIEQMGGKSVRAGGYTISPSMDAWTVAKILSSPPAFAFVTFPPAIRKEQMGEMLADALNWTDEELQEWNSSATNPDPSFTEGVYFPDTYLIPSDQTPTQVAARMRGRFTDEFAPYAVEAQEKNIPWTDVLTLASIVDREAGKTDKPLVAGILWNRLDTGMKLQADATLQYIKGTKGNWWPVPTGQDKYLNSAFNTYMHTGLPPHPIDNPSLASIDAVLNPENTDCLFYLHDAEHDIHCSLTYAGQKKNVDTYLR